MTTPSTQRRGARGRKLAASVALAGVTILTFPAVAQAAPGDPTPEQCFTFNAASGTITGFDTQCGDEVVIPSALGGATVTTIGPNAFRDTGITGITFPEALQTIEAGAFIGTDLGDVVLPDSVRTIGTSAFQDAGLTAITIPAGTQTIGENALVANDLSTLVFPDSLAQIPSGVARDNPSLTSIVFGTDAYEGTHKWSLSGFTAEDLGGDGLTEVYFGPAVRLINGFENNDLTEVTIPGNSTSVGYDAFRNNKISHVTVQDGAGTLYDGAFDLNPVDEVEFEGDVYWLMPSPFGHYRDKDAYAQFLSTVPAGASDEEFAQLEAEWTDETAMYTRANIYDENLLRFFRQGWTDSTETTPATHGFVVNPATYTVNYLDAVTGDAIADPYVSGVGVGLTDFRVAANPTGDLTRYYRFRETRTITPPAIQGYAEAAPVQLLPERGQNTVNVAYTPLAAPAPEGTPEPGVPGGVGAPAPDAPENAADPQVIATGGFDSTAVTITAGLALLLGAGGLGFFLLRRRGGGTPAV
jgi:hypothetical protein